MASGERLLAELGPGQLDILGAAYIPPAALIEDAMKVERKRVGELIDSRVYS